VWQPYELLYTCYLLTYLLTYGDGDAGRSRERERERETSDGVSAVRWMYARREGGGRQTTNSRCRVAASAGRRRSTGDSRRAGPAGINLITQRADNFLTAVQFRCWPAGAAAARDPPARGPARPGPGLARAGPAGEAGPRPTVAAAAASKIVVVRRPPADIASPPRSRCCCGGCGCGPRARRDNATDCPSIHPCRRRCSLARRTAARGR